ncbi:hypothetical protein LguiB_020818 [Lonicera macranthoides]
MDTESLLVVSLMGTWTKLMSSVPKYLGTASSPLFRHCLFPPHGTTSVFLPLAAGVQTSLSPAFRAPAFRAPAPSVLLHRPLQLHQKTKAKGEFIKVVGLVRSQDDDKNMGEALAQYIIRRK